MGSLAGHVIPGTFLILYGLAWCVLSIWLHLTSRKTPTAKKFRCLRKTVSKDTLQQRSWLPLCCCPNIPLEPILKICLPALAIFIELFLDYSYEGGKKRVVWRVYRAYTDDGLIRDQAKLHHVTMHSGFLLSGVVDILAIFVSLPACTSKLFLSLALSIEFILFRLHTMGRDELNIQIHSILVFIIFICLIFSLLRLFSSNSLVINLGLGSSLLLQGTWLIQAGHFLFTSFLSTRVRHGKSAGHHDHHGVLMFFAETFAWHMLLVAIGNLVLWLVLSLLVGGRVLRRSSSSEGAGDAEECASLIERWDGGDMPCRKEEEMVEMTTKLV